MKDILLDEVYIYVLDRTLRQIKKYSNKEISKHGVKFNSDQWVIIKRIHENPGINQKELAGLTFKDPASINRSIESLTHQGLIIKSTNKSDSRSFDLMLTNKGERYVKDIVPIAKEIRKKGLSGITKEEQKELRRLLNKIYINFE